jgi:hypothetical protein
VFRIQTGNPRRVRRTRSKDLSRRPTKFCRIDFIPLAEEAQRKGEPHGRNRNCESNLDPCHICNANARQVSWGENCVQLRGTSGHNEGRTDVRRGAGKLFKELVDEAGLRDTDKESAADGFEDCGRGTMLVGIGDTRGCRKMYGRTYTE